MVPLLAILTLFPYTTLFRSGLSRVWWRRGLRRQRTRRAGPRDRSDRQGRREQDTPQVEGRTSVRRILLAGRIRSEEHTSELQSPYDLVCRLLLEKKKKTK